MVLSFTTSSAGIAQVVTDGTTGPGQALSGPDYAIDADLGTQAGSNLFHSFEEFSIRTGESATFSGPGNIENVIGRVTGGDVSSIDGRLASSIPEADLWLFNPAGVVFGLNATLDLTGSFHAWSLKFGLGAHNLWRDVENGPARQRYVRQSRSSR
jgi:filamentous hemagglutinin family protein